MTVIALCSFIGSRSHVDSYKGKLCLISVMSLNDRIHDTQFGDFGRTSQSIIPLQRVAGSGEFGYAQPISPLLHEADCPTVILYVAALQFCPGSVIGLGIKR